MNPPPPPQEATDIFSISDQLLAERLQFIEEIGFGNWGSVWLCRPKPDPPSSSGAPPKPNDNKIAVKLVHRSKTSTTAARVRSLWNEMKVVRSLKHEPHPSIIPFYSFIITPSYALITMAYHPRLVPVEVAEHHAKEWFRSLLSGVDFLHRRGVVHNDIKPANILLSSENVPILVDFGFAERYDTTSTSAFHSNLSYGTPEYLSPERARGLPHDTRKSDVWSLGITFFEILVGRTPFEYSEGEQFSTKEDLEKYWARTMKGKWVGSWKMSEQVEKLLRRMIAPNADLRCTALDAMEDLYWKAKVDKEVKKHRKAASVAQPPSPSVAALNASDVSKLIEISSPWSPRSNMSITTPSTKEKKEKEKDRSSKIPVACDKENVASPPGLFSTVKEKRVSKRIAVESKHARSYSQPKFQSVESPKPRSKPSKPSNAPPGTPQITSIFSALSPIPQLRIAPTPLNTPESSLNLPPSLSSLTSRQQTTDPVFTSPATNVSSGSVRVKKPAGPRERRGSASPVSSLNSRRVERDGKERESIDESVEDSAVAEVPPPVPEKEYSPVVLRESLRESKDGKEKDKRRRSRVFGVDLTALSRNANSASANNALKASKADKKEKEREKEKEKTSRKPAVLAPSSTNGVTKRKAVPVVEKENVRDKENTHGSVSRRTTTTASKVSSTKASASASHRSSTVATSTSTKVNSTAATSPTPTSPEAKQDSVRDRMLEWERDRARLRMLALESETERESEAERQEMRVKRVEEERRERVEEEKRRRVEEMMREMEERRQREREMEAEAEAKKLAEAERELEREREREKEREMQEAIEREIRERERRRFVLPQIAVLDEPEEPVESPLPTPLSPLMEESFESRFLDEFTRSGNESSLNLLKQSLKMSIDGAVRLYKSSTALALGRSTNGSELNAPTPPSEDGDSRHSVSARASWENDALVREAKSSLPVVRHAVRNEQLAQESQLDRMTIWIRNVEKVVEDARQNFNASSPSPKGPLPPLPVAPATRPRSTTISKATSSANTSNDLSKSQRSQRSATRVPRKILAANQIFVNEYDGTSPVPSPLASSFECSALTQSPMQMSFLGAVGAERERSFVDNTLPTIPSEDERSRVEPVVMHTPNRNRARRATVVTRSPEPKVASVSKAQMQQKRLSLEVDTSPSKRREKSRSQNDLCRAITPVTQLEFEIERLSKPTPPGSQRLSAVVDRSVFIRPGTPGANDFESSIVMNRSLRTDDLTSSPLHVDPYPTRPVSQLGLVLDTPAKKHVESVYDRFLMSTTGVKRNGRGYQSDNFGPVKNNTQPKVISKSFFMASRRPMPPPVSSEDWRDLPADEFGTMHSTPSPRVTPGYTTSYGKSEGVSKFRSALRTIVNGKQR